MLNGRWIERETDRDVIKQIDRETGRWTVRQGSRGWQTGERQNSRVVIYVSR